MIRIHRAIFGDRNGAHGLLGSSLEERRIPRGLAGRVDRPGDIAAGIQWSPLLGCAPMDDWWCVWRTFEDRGASRGGMVQSHVALVSQTEIGEVEALRIVLDSLPTAPTRNPEATVLEVVPVPVAAPPTFPRGYGALANAIAAPPLDRPVIFPDDGDIEEILCTLWQNLWPAARMRLACESVFDPGSIERGRTRWFVTTPAALATRWKSRGFTVIEKSAPNEEPRSPLAELLYGRKSTSIVTLIAQLPEATLGTSESLAKLNRLAPLWHDVQGGDADASTVRAALSFVIALAPRIEQSAEIKSLLIVRTLELLKRGNAQAFLGLANLQTEALGALSQELGTAIEDFAANQPPAMIAEDSKKIFDRLRDGGFEAWWLESVNNGIRQGLERLSPEWVKATFNWFAADAELVGRLEPMISTALAAQDRLIAHWPEALSKETSEALTGLARKRGWSVLHAKALLSGCSPQEALRRQCALPSGPQEGLTLMLKALPPDEVVTAALELGDSNLVREAGKMIAKNGMLLAGFDPLSPAWRALWLAALNAGASLWAGIREPHTICKAMFDLVLDDSALESDLLRRVLPDAGDEALKYPRRQQLWSALDTSTRSALADSTARAWIREFEAGARTAPEEPLAAAILQRVKVEWVRSGQPLARLLDFLELFPTIEEGNFVTWVNAAPLTLPISAQTVTRIGELISGRRWRRLLDIIVSQTHRGRYEFRPVLERCSHMFSVWERIEFYVSSLFDVKSQPSSDDLEKALLEVALELYPDGPMQNNLWEDAGGEACDIPYGRDGRERWERTLRDLQQGKHSRGRLRALVKEMLERRPNHARLGQLWNLLR